MGLTSALALAPAAYISSVLLSRPVICELIETPSQYSAIDMPHLLEAHKQWSSQVRPADRTPLPELARKGISLHHLMQYVHRYTTDTLPSDDHRRCAMRALISVRGAKDWLRCAPSPGMRTHIPNRAWRVCMRYYTGTPLFSAGICCMRSGCAEVLDVHGDHLLHCPRGVNPRNAPLRWRHDSLVRQFAGILSRAARAPAVEPADIEDSLRPDIRATGARGGYDFLDIVVVNPLSTHKRRDEVIRCPDTHLTSASNRKSTKYHHLVAAAPAGSKVVPIALSTVGGWHPQARQYFVQIAKHIASTTTAPQEFVASTMFHRLAASMVRLNANCLLDGFPHAI